MRTPSLLIIDDNADSRFLLVKTLLRKFPSAALHECVSAEHAIEFCRREQPHAVVVHRTVEVSGLQLVPQLREVCPDTPILFVSSIDRMEAALEAGADGFLLYDEWLRVGTVLARIMAGSTRRAKPESESSGSN